MVDIALAAADLAQRLAQKTYDAILIDWRMFKALPTFPSHLPATIILGNPDGAVPPVHAVIRKPIEFGSLVETVAECVK